VRSWGSLPAGVACSGAGTVGPLRRRMFICLLMQPSCGPAAHPLLTSGPPPPWLPGHRTAQQYVLEQLRAAAAAANAAGGGTTSAPMSRSASGQLSPAVPGMQDGYAMQAPADVVRHPLQVVLLSCWHSPRLCNAAGRALLPSQLTLIRIPPTPVLGGGIRAALLMPHAADAAAGARCHGGGAPPPARTAGAAGQGRQPEPHRRRQRGRGHLCHCCG